VADLLIKRLKEEIARQRYNYKSLSLAAGLGETTVRDIMIGRARNPRRDTLMKIAKTLGKPLIYLLADEVATVPVIDTGIPRRGRRTSAGVREHAPSADCEYVEAPPELGYRDIAAVRMRGDAMLPFLPDGTLLYYHEPLHTGFDVHLGRLVVVRTEEGAVSAAILERGSAYGRYDLAGYNVKTVKNVAIEWCAKVIFIRPA
jgi:transcriptional regulator with XRE-family HTH domain